LVLLEDFVEAFGVWDIARPYLGLIADDEDIRLVLALRDSPATVEETAGRLGFPVEEAAALLLRAYSRCVVDRVEVEGRAAYAAGTFYNRLDHFAKYENWDDIPLADRRRIDRRFLDAFIARHRSTIQLKIQGLEAGNSLPNDTVLLLPEVEEMLDAATLIALQPCDCRRLGQYCGRPVGTCFSLDDTARAILDRGHGRRLAREEAKELVRWADKQGLMHTSDSEWRVRGLHAICNCCGCDCYPFRAAQELGSKGVWPRSRWVVDYDKTVCTLCGACVRRCHFGAFYHDGTTSPVDGREKANVRFDPDRCWGCGLCANTCPSGAAVMIRLGEGGSFAPSSARAS
jgi:ferredoxin